jgi:hypothetical protein
MGLMTYGTLLHKLLYIVFQTFPIEKLTGPVKSSLNPRMASNGSRVWSCNKLGL